MCSRWCTDLYRSVYHPLHTQTSSNSTTIAADSSNGVTNTSCCRYSFCAPGDGWRYHPKHVEQFPDTYGLELWGCASNSNIAIIQRFQSKLLRATVNASRYITNAMIHSDLGITTVQDVIHKRSNKHRAKLQSHPNPLLQSLSRDNIPRRLKRRWPTDL